MCSRSMGVSVMPGQLEVYRHESVPFRFGGFFQKLHQYLPALLKRISSRPQRATVSFTVA